jgi:cysteine desulfurase
MQHCGRLKAGFIAGLSGVDYDVNGDPSRTQSHVINLSFHGTDSEALMMALRDTVAISNGSACTSSQYAPSHVLKAMGFDEDRISSAVRISWGQGIASLPVEAFADAVRQLRA